MDRRFIDRVFAADEQEAISVSDDPTIEVWSRWAAKETGFKVISKVIGQPPPFVHRAFRVAWSAQESAGKTGAETVIRRVTRWAVDLLGDLGRGLSLVSPKMCGFSMRYLGH